MAETKLTPEIIEIVVAGISDGIPLRQLARQNGFGKSAFYERVAKDEELAGRIARAREIGFDNIAEEILEIIDNVDEDPASRRVRYDGRLKLLAKWDPKRYGEKIEHEHKGGITVVTGNHDADL
jgi:hypothetical protein